MSNARRAKRYVPLSEPQEPPTPVVGWFHGPMGRTPFYGFTDYAQDRMTRLAYKQLCEATGQEPDWQDAADTYVTNMPGNAGNPITPSTNGDAAQ